MAITFDCPECGKSFDLEDSMAGRKAACECGAVLFVPEAPDAPEGQTRCPSCGELADENAVLCIGCGHNYQTGGRVRSAESRIPDEEEDPKLILAKRLAKPIIFIIIASFVAFVVYKSFYAKSYGVSSSTPIGTKEGISTHLGKAKYVQLKDDKAKVPKGFPEGATIIAYKDKILADQSKNMFNEKIRVIFSKDGKALCVAANFRGGVKTIPGDTGSKTGRFMVYLWKQAGGPTPPEYKQVTVKGEYYSTTHNAARFAEKGAKGEWIENPSDISIIPSQNTMILYFDEYGDFSYDDLVPAMVWEYKTKKNGVKKENSKKVKSEQ